MGFYDAGGSPLGGFSWKFKRSDGWGFDLCKRSGDAVHHHAGNHVLLERDHGNREQIRSDPTDVTENEPCPPVPVSKDSQRPWGL